MQGYLSGFMITAAHDAVRRRRRGRQLEAELLDAAWDELVEAGVANLTTRQVRILRSDAPSKDVHAARGSKPQTGTFAPAFIQQINPVLHDSR